MKDRFNFIIVVIGALVGLAVSIFTTLEHYGAATAEFCSINETFNCDIVNGSKYSELFGIPVALLGIIAYGFFFAAALAVRKNHNEKLMNLMVFGSVLALLFSLYLTYIEAFVLYTWCILCLTSLAANLVVAIGIFRWHKAGIVRVE
jgi:vitamin-K-epoxide reductase (warfarin-sensitive)